MNDSNNKGDKYNPYQVSSGNSPFIADNNSAQLPNTPHAGNASIPSMPIPMQPVHPTPLNEYGSTDPIEPISAVPDQTVSMQNEFINPQSQPVVPTNPQEYYPRASSPSGEIPQTTEASYNQSPSMEQNPQLSADQPNLNDVSTVQMLTVQSGKGVRNSRIFLFLGIFVVVTILIGIGVYFLLGREDAETKTVDVVEEIDQLEEAGITPDPRQTIEYPSTKLIGEVSSLLSSNAFSILGMNTLTRQTGCVYSVELLHRLNGADSYSRYVVSHPSQTTTEACEFEEDILPYKEFYVLEGGTHGRLSVEEELELLIDEDLLLANEFELLQNIIPYPTLITVVNAYEVSNVRIDVIGEFSLADQKGEYTFIIVDDQITNIVYTVENDGTSQSGELSIDYMEPNIVLPQLNISS